MRHKLINTLAIVIAGWTGLAASLANAQTTGPGTYVPVSSWDQKFQCDTQANCPRFVVLSDSE